MVEFYIDTNKVKFISTDVGLYLRLMESKDYYYVRLPVSTVWSSIKDTSYKKIKIDDSDYRHFRLNRFDAHIKIDDFNTS
jgi:hypothetical protein